MKRLIILILLIGMLGSCIVNTLPKEMPFPRTYEGVTFDEVWGATLQTAMELDYSILHSEKSSGVMLLEKESSMGDRIFVGRNAEDPRFSVLMLERASGTIEVSLKETKAPLSYDNPWSTSFKEFAKFLDWFVSEGR